MIRRKLILLSALLMLSILLSSPIASTSQSILQDIEPLSTGGNWKFADSSEYPMVFNNLEDFIDQLSDLHNESDIGTHSNPAALRSLDGVYDILTSDNITIPEQLIEDPLNETPSYNQSLYESWRLDLEGGWTDVDYDEISAELCVFGGTQAEEALRVDIWSDGNWVNVISDVTVGWNNASIAPSLTNKTLEMRFTGSNTDNTSVQSIWEIDAVLLHTWTTVYSEEFTSNGLVQDLGNNLSRYIASVGETNTWDAASGTWHRYLYDPEAKTVRIGNLTISHLEGGSLSIDGAAGSRVGKLSWYIQAYYADQWNNITLDNYQFVGFTKTDDNMSMKQRFWGTLGEMNVTTTYSYFGGFKTRIDIRNDAAQAVPIRAIWAARDVSGIQDNYELLYNEDDVLYGIQIEDATFSWYDVLVSDNPLPTQTIIDKQNRRAAVIFGNQSTIIPSGYTATIDPTYTVAADADDNYWDTWEAPVRYDGATDNKIQTDGSSYTYVTTLRVPLTIIAYSTVTQAELSVYVSAESGANSVTVKRIDALSAAVLEGGSYPSIDSSPTGTLLIGATGLITSDDIGDLVQEQINQAGWTGSGQYMGFKLEPTGVCGHTIHDRQKDDQPPYLTVIFSEPSSNWLTGYMYRQGHSITGKTGAGNDYQIEITVEYGAGTSTGGTVYTNSHCQTDFDDIRFTDNDGQFELDYWMEEKTDSDDATFWVEVSDDLGYHRVIYCYYGNDGVSTTSDGDATFIAFDDFEDNNLDKWEAVDPTYTATQSGTVYAGTYAVFINPPAGAATGMRYNFTDHVGTLTYSVMMTYYVRTSTTGKVWYDRLTGTDGGTGYDMVLGGVTGYVSYYDGVYKKYPNDVTFGSAWQEIRHAIYPSGSSTQQVWRAGVDCGSIDYGPINNNDDLKCVSYSVQKALDGWMDNFYVRKWFISEPVNYNWGREQHAPNNPPTNDGTPIISNDDDNYLYSRLRKYEVITYHKDLDGFDDITHVEFSVYGDDRITRYFYGRFTHDGDVFSEEGTTGQKNSWELDTSGSSHSETPPNDLDITWKFWVEWVCSDITTLDVRCTVWDAEAVNTTYHEVNWDIETDLVTTFTLDDGSGTADRGNYDSIDSITASGTTSYEGSGGGAYPPSGDADVYIRCADVAGSDWYDTTLTSGQWSMTVDSDDVTGLDTYYVKVVDEGDDYDDTSLLASTTSDTYIADMIVIQTTVSSDAEDRLDVDGNVEIRVTAHLAHTGGGTVWLGAGDTMTLDGVAMSWDAGNSWFELTRSKATVGIWNYYVNSSSETRHGITALDLNSQDVDVIWDEIEVYYEHELDPRGNVGEQNYPRFRLQLKYDDHLLDESGYDAVWINGSVAIWSGGGSFWYKFYTMETVGSWNFLVTSASEHTYGITALDSTSATTFDVDIIWDRVQVQSYSASDERDNVNDNVNIDTTLWYDYDDTLVTDGTVTINGYSAAHQGSGVWRITRTSASVTAVVYNNVQASGNTHGITVEDQNSQSQEVIWDEIEVYYGQISDARTNVDENEHPYFRLRLKYDNHLVDVSSADWIKINGSGATWSAGLSAWFKYYTQSTVGTWNFLVTEAYEITYGITAFDSASAVAYDQDIIWDKVQVQSYSVSDSRDDINDNVNIDATLWYDYDNTQVTDGTVTINGYSASHQGSGVWRITRTSASVTSVTYNTVAASGNTHGITVVDQNGQSQQVIWDQVVFTFAVNVTWTVIDYYVNVSWVGIYDFDDTTYLGTEVVYNDGGVLTFSTVGNRTFYIVSMDDSAGYDLTEFTTNTVWCVWDDVIPASAIDTYWHTQISYSYLTWAPVSTWKLEFNDTYLTNDYILHVYSNSSSPEATGGIYGAGNFGGLTVGPYDISWYYVNLTANCEVTINSVSYDWQVWQDVLDVDILHTIRIEDSGMDVQDVWLTFYFHTNWNNASFTIWDNSSVEGHSPCEGWYQIAKPTVVGLHNYTVLINGTHGIEGYDTQNRDFSVNSAWVWRNFKFTVNPVVLTIIYGELDVAYNEVAFSGTASKPADVTIYEDDVQVGVTSVETGTFAFYWTRASSESAGNVRYALKFVNGTDIVWQNGSYAKVLITAFKVETWWMSLQLGVESYVEFYVLTSFENATVYVYDNETLMTTVTESEGGVYSYFWMNEVQGLHVVVLNITYGSTVYTRTRTYYIPDWAVTGLVVRWDLWTYQDNYTLIQLESNWMNCTYYVYLNSSLVATSYNDPVTLNFTREINTGAYNLTIYADGGSQTYSVKNIRYIVTEEGVSYDFSTVSGGVTYVYTYEGDDVTIYENPEGVFMDKSTAAIIAVGGFLIIFVAYLVARTLLVKDREKTERTYSR